MKSMRLTAARLVVSVAWLLSPLSGLAAELPDSGADATACEAFGASPANTALGNALAIQECLDQTGRVSLTLPGIYQVASLTSGQSTVFRMPSDTDFHIGAEVILIRTDAGKGTLMFTNADPVNGNRNIRLHGAGLLYFNADSYRDTLLTNPTFPAYPALFKAALPGIRNGSSSLNPHGYGISFDNVDNLYVGGLTLMQPMKYLLYGSKITRFTFENLRLYGDDLINPATPRTLGRDGIHVQGNSHNGVIRNISGVTNDDFVALNVRDVRGNVTPRSVGNMSDIHISHIYSRNIRRGGNSVALYGGLDQGTVNPPSSNGADRAPAVVSITHQQGKATVQTLTPHEMEPGQFFYIRDAVPAGYNTGTAEPGQTPGRVESVIDTHRFVYRVAVDTPPYQGSATLVRYYRLRNITVENVVSTTFHGGGLSLGTFDVVNGNYGVLENIKADGIDTFATNPAGKGVVAVYGSRLHNATLKNLVSSNETLFPVFNGGFAENPSLTGVISLIKPVSRVPYKPYAPSGQCWITAGRYQVMAISEPKVDIINGGGGWRFAITGGSTPESHMFIWKARISDVDGASASLFANHLWSNMGQVYITSPELATPTTSIATVGGNVRSGLLQLDNWTGTAGMANAPLFIYGSGIRVELIDNILPGRISGGGVIFSSTQGANSATLQNNDFASNRLFTGNSTGTWAVLGNDALQTPAFVSPYTPDLKFGTRIRVGTLTAAMTINDPDNVPLRGEEVHITLTQDGVGGRDVSWGSRYNFPQPWTNAGNAGNRSTTVTFESDGVRLTAKNANVWE